MQSKKFIVTELLDLANGQEIVVQVKNIHVAFAAFEIVLNSIESYARIFNVKFSPFPFQMKAKDLPHRYSNDNNHQNDDEFDLQVNDSHLSMDETHISDTIDDDDVDEDNKDNDNNKNVDISESIESIFEHNLLHQFILIPGKTLNLSGFTATRFKLNKKMLSLGEKKEMSDLGRLKNIGAVFERFRLGKLYVMLNFQHSQKYLFLCFYRITSTKISKANCIFVKRPGPIDDEMKVAFVTLGLRPDLYFDAYNKDTLIIAKISGSNKESEQEEFKQKFTKKEKEYIGTYNDIPKSNHEIPDYLKEYEQKPFVELEYAKKILQKIQVHQPHSDSICKTVREHYHDILENKNDLVKEGKEIDSKKYQNDLLTQQIMIGQETIKKPKIRNFAVLDHITAADMSDMNWFAKKRLDKAKSKHKDKLLKTAEIPEDWKEKRIRKNLSR